MDTELQGWACLLFPVFLLLLFIVAIVLNRRAARAREAPSGGDPQVAATERGWHYQGRSGRVIFRIVSSDWVIEAARSRRMPGSQTPGPRTTWSRPLPTHGEPVVVGPQPPAAIRSLDPNGKKLVALFRGFLVKKRDPVERLEAVVLGHAEYDDRYLTAAVDVDSAQGLLADAAKSIVAWSGPSLQLFHVDDELRLSLDGVIGDGETLDRLVALGEEIVGEP